jgi:hypothetical protein
LKVGSFVPEQASPVLYAMAGDDCSLHHDLTTLTPKQRDDHQENQILTCALQVALTGLGKSTDHIALSAPFAEPEWNTMLRHYGDLFRRMGLAGVPAEHWQYHPLNEYYESVAANTPVVDLINLYMVSGSNFPLHLSIDALRVSRNVNSKVHFADHAPDYGIPVPHTETFRKQDIRAGAADPFFAAYPDGVMLKLLGLAGSRNVFSLNSVDECLSYITEYDDASLILLQEKLDTHTWQEMTVDLTIKPDSIEVSNVRKILFAGGKWVGNYIAPELGVSEAHAKVLDTVGRYARAQGHVAEDGVNCGIDYFVSGEEVIVTEINARWTGGLFPAEFLRRLRVSQPAVAFFDMIPCADRDALRSFQSDNLFPATDSAFGYLPMGFTPFALEVERAECFFAWQVVTGDFAEFVKARDLSLPEHCFPTATLILKEALS